MLMDRRALAGGGALVVLVLVMHVVARTALAGSAAVVALVDIGLPLLEVMALCLACVAFVRNRATAHRWTWLLLATWLGANLFADVVWGWYELVLGTQPSSPSLADVGYLVSYPLAFLTVVFATWKAVGRLRAAEAAVDATMFTLGAVGLAWPLLLAPLLTPAGIGAADLINLAYPVGDILVIIAFASLLLGSWDQRPPRFLVVVWLAFLIQVVADSLYFVEMARNGTYQSGGGLDSLWALVFALAGAAAFMGIFPSRPHSAESVVPRDSSPTLRVSVRSGYARMLIPYLALPLVGVMIWRQNASYGWTTETRVLVYFGLALVVLLVGRQYLTLVHNRKLNTNLSILSEELSDRVGVLADLTGRLEELNTRANELNTLRSLEDVTHSGLELACSVAKSPAAWITLRQRDGSEPVVATMGESECVPEVGALFASPPCKRTREVRLKARGEEIGSLWFARPAEPQTGPDLVQAVAAHVATAVDNIRRYEEILRLAERDPLTGLLNYGGIHRRLSTEGHVAQQLGRQLAVVMIDLDDFKLLNDTYGHPTGDRVLMQVSDTIRTVLRQTDLAGRVGGDEMMLVLPDTDREGAIALAERLRDELTSRMFDAGGTSPIPLRVSLGVAAYPEDTVSPNALVAAADANLYASKQRGGGVVTGGDGSTTWQPEQTVGLRSVADRLMDVLGAKDHYARRHSDQVMTHSVRLAELLGLPEESIDTLRLAAMLHDVGKIGIQDRVLRKPGPLTTDEEKAMRRHVSLGETIIRDLPRVTEVLEVVRAHHERHDGKGYPVGMQGEEIPLLARIIAIADAYSAMVADTPYRRGLTTEQAKKELLKVAGDQLDPELVERFVSGLNEERAPLFAATA